MGVERQPVSERIDDAHLPHAPGHCFNPRPRESISPIGQVLVQGVDFVGFDSDGGSRRGVPVVFREVYNAAVSGDLHVERKIILESMLPIDRKAEEFDVELPGFCFIEYSENRNGPAQTHETE